MTLAKLFRNLAHKLKTFDTTQRQRNTLCMIWELRGVGGRPLAPSGDKAHQRDRDPGHGRAAEGTGAFRFHNVSFPDVRGAPPVTALVF